MSLITANPNLGPLLYRIDRFNIDKYLASLPFHERQAEWQSFLDAIQRDKEREKRERDERLVIPHDIDVRQYGFASYKEAECAWCRIQEANAYVEYSDYPVDDVRVWLNDCRKDFLKNQKIENKKRKQRELYELQVRSQELAKWQLEREEERGMCGVRVKISKRKRLLMWLKRG